MNVRTKSRQRRHKSRRRHRQTISTTSRRRTSSASHRQDTRQHQDSVRTYIRRTRARNIPRNNRRNSHQGNPRQEVKRNSRSSDHRHNRGSIQGGNRRHRDGPFLAVVEMRSGPATVRAVDVDTSIEQTVPFGAYPSAVSVAPLVDNAPKVEWDALITVTVSRIMSGVVTARTCVRTTGTSTVGVA